MKRLIALLTAGVLCVFILAPAFPDPMSSVGAGIGACFAGMGVPIGIGIAMSFLVFSVGGVSWLAGRNNTRYFEQPPTYSALPPSEKIGEAQSSIIEGVEYHYERGNS